MRAVDGLIGKRVALRHRVGERAGRPLLSDAVGELARGGPGELLVHTRRGAVRVRTEAVVAVRQVPPAAPRRPSWAAVAALEGGCADAWPAVVDRPLGAWRLRASAGFGRSANSALVIGDAGMALPAALDAVRAFAAAQDVAPLARVPAASPWETGLAAAGWADDAGATDVLVAGLDELLAGIGPGAGLDHVGFGRLAGQTVRAAIVRQHLHLRHPGSQPADRPAAAAHAPYGAAIRWAHELGARWAVLELDPADPADDTVLAGWRELGFVMHHRMRYVRPS